MRGYYLNNPELYPGDLQGGEDDKSICGCGDERCPVCYPDACPPPKGGEGRKASASRDDYDRSKIDPYDSAWGLDR